MTSDTQRENGAVERKWVRERDEGDRKKASGKWGSEERMFGFFEPIHLKKTDKKREAQTPEKNRSSV